MSEAQRDIEPLIRMAAELRGAVIETSYRAGIPHLGSCLSCIDILVAFYWGTLSEAPTSIAGPERDRFILSKGHAAPALFQVLARKGMFPPGLMSQLEHYGADGTLFGEHPPAHGIPGVEAATGSLGHGLPIGVGMSLASRMRGYDNRVYVLMSDGECNEGSVWEAAMMAGAQRLDSLAVIIDFNKWQATGRSEEVLALNPLAAKWEAFGWSAYEVDGHDIAALMTSLQTVPGASGKPTAIIAHTVKGKGVSFMEDDNNWHYRIPKQEELLAARMELGLTP